MKFKVGQKVSFLNEARNGIVKKILNDKMVSVEIDDGFELPVMEHELVSAEPYLASDIAASAKAPVAAPVVEEEDNDFPDREVLNLSVKTSLRKGLYLAYVPVNPEKPLQDGMYATMINYTPYDIIFTYAVKRDQKFVHYAYERATCNSRVVLEYIEASEIQDWSSIKFQILYYKEDSADAIDPQLSICNINPIKFYRDETYKEEPLIGTTAIILPLGDSGEDVADEPVLTEKPKGLKVVGHINDIINKDAFPEKHLVSKGIAEVDLHIDELVDSIEGLSNVQMLSTQVDYFRKMLESAIQNHLQRIIFIHGVGNGKLKAEVRKILAEEYPSYEIYDASMAKYGVGATEVKIPFNRE